MTPQELLSNTRWRPPWSKRCRWRNCEKRVDRRSRFSIVDQDFREITSVKLCDTHLAAAINSLVAG